MVKPVAVYGNEIWPVTEMDRESLNKWERKMLRRINEPVLEQGMWRMRTDQELGELYKGSETGADIKKEKKDWSG
jgi:hypothetical protein